MLYATAFSTHASVKEVRLESTWHVGMSTTRIQNLAEDLRYNLELQADGDELTYIENRFSNIPKAQQRVVRWFGDTARFIAYNL